MGNGLEDRVLRSNELDLHEEAIGRYTPPNVCLLQGIEQLMNPWHQLYFSRSEQIQIGPLFFLVEHFPVGIQVWKLGIDRLFERRRIEMGRLAKFYETPIEIISTARQHVDISLVVKVFGVDEQPVKIEEKELEISNPFHLINPRGKQVATID